jgi:hypothetical protein
MGRYDKFAHQSKPKPQRNPIWRGIGCILMIIIPLMTYAMTVLLIPTLIGTGLVPPVLQAHIRFPDWAYKLVFLKDIVAFLGGINNLGLGILVFIVILLLLTGISSLIYVTVLQSIGPARYGPTDAPPTGYKPKAYKR